MATQENRKRKRNVSALEDTTSQIHAMLAINNVGEYGSNLKQYVQAMNRLKTLINSGLDFGMLVAESLLDDVLMHLKGPSTTMHSLCCETLVLCSVLEQHKEHIRSTDVIKELVNILKMCRESSSALDTETVCTVMNAIAHLIDDCAQGINIDDGIPLFHQFFARADFKLRTSALHVLKNLCYKNEANVMEVSVVAPKIILSLAKMLVCKDNKIHHSALQLIFSLGVYSPALVEDEDFPTDIVIRPILNIIGNERKNLPKPVILGLGILCSIVKVKTQYKVALGQLGVIPMLMKTVQSDDELVQLFTIGLLRELSQDVYNQVAMVNGGALPKLFDLFNIPDPDMQQGIRGVLFNIVKNKVIISKFITEGWFEKILDLKGGTFGHYENETGDVAKILQRLQCNHHHVREELLILMRESVQREKVRIAVALAHFSRQGKHFKQIFGDNGGLDLLVDSLIGASNSDHVAVALYKLTEKVLPELPVEPKGLKVDNVKKRYKKSVEDSDQGLFEACIFFILKNFRDVVRSDGMFADEMVPKIRSYLEKLI